MIARRVEPTLVLKERGTKRTWARLVCKKGLEDKSIAQWLANAIDRFGCKKVEFRTDNESAIVALATEVKRLREDGSMTMLSNPPIGDSQGNAVAERGVGIVHGLARTLKDALEVRRQAKISTNMAIVRWIMRHAAELYSSHQVGSTARGRTKDGRVKGGFLLRWNSGRSSF